jgi:hypothetical protein
MSIQFLLSVYKLAVKLARAGWFRQAASGGGLTYVIRYLLCSAAIMVSAFLACGIVKKGLEHGDVVFHLYQWAEAV